MTVTTYDPHRVIADLRALAARTGGPDGSRRLAWTPEWLEARALLREELATLPVEVDQDEAGNSHEQRPKSHGCPDTTRTCGPPAPSATRCTQASSRSGQHAR